MKQFNSDDLKQIRQRTQQATNGPWVVRERILSEFFTERSITTSWIDPKLHWPAPIVAMTQVEGKNGIWIEEENANFIAQSRENITSLLSALDVFGHPVIYQALLRYFKESTLEGEERGQLEAALKICWEIIKANKEPSAP